MASFWRRYGVILLCLAGIALVSAGGLYARSQPLDVQLFRTINSCCAGPTLDALATLGYVLGSFWFSLGLFVALFFLGYRSYALSALGAIAAGALLVLLIKWVTQQPRPWQELPGVHVVGFRTPDLGYPSGHASQAFLTAFLLVGYFRFRWYAQAGIYTLAGLVALSRVYAGEHLPADIAAGALIGTLVGVLWVNSPLWPRPSQARRS